MNLKQLKYSNSGQLCQLTINHVLTCFVRGVVSNILANNNNDLVTGCDTQKCCFMCWDGDCVREIATIGTNFMSDRYKGFVVFNVLRYCCMSEKAFKKGNTIFGFRTRFLKKTYYICCSTEI